MRLTCLALLTVNSIACAGQDYFADNLKNSSWISDGKINTHTLRGTKEIELTKLKVIKDSLKISRTIWTFKDDLTISYYDPIQGQEKLILTCKYTLDKSKGLLNIEISDQELLTFKTGIVSTGNFILLTRKGKKKK